MVASSASQSCAADFVSVSSTRLQIEGRTADDLEHVGGGGLLTQRLGHLISPLAQLRQKTRILHSDDSLISKNSHQINLPLCEWLRCDLSYEDHTDYGSLA